MKNKYGWVTCCHCNRQVSATKRGLAVRHGFIRVKRGYIRVNIPSARSGHDTFPCEGSGKAGKYWSLNTIAPVNPYYK